MKYYIYYTIKQGSYKEKHQRCEICYTAREKDSFLATLEAWQIIIVEWAIQGGKCMSYIEFGLAIIGGAIVFGAIVILLAIVENEKARNEK